MKIFKITFLIFWIFFTKDGIANAAIDAITALTRHNWPGNVRELKNLIERACILFQGQEVTSTNVTENLLRLKAPNTIEEQNEIWEITSELSDDLADTEIEKFKSLTTDVEFADEESFREKVSTIKESYFPKTQTSESAGTSIDDEQGGTAQDVDTTDTMQKYMSAISRDHKASA